ncbi:MAG TPA: sigma-54 dependent transcriptional regulator, partial [Anaeromyxobacteraceae bacterium]|nr:sigma-54 dependent transcriptional regulator [Anaeromyxobacteraceae bacterium]
MARVLVVDDEPGLIYALKSLVQTLGHEPVVARSGAEALERLEGVDAVVTDFSMPGMDGLQLLEAIRQRDELLPVVIITAHGSERLAVRAMKQGAYEYVAKPFEFDELSVVIERALETRALRLRNRFLTAERVLGRTIVGEAPAMRRLLDAVARVAPKDVTVLVRGETGTGKELVAGLLHAQSRRSDGPLVRFNCAAIPGELAEAELFGHVRGAFTGATAPRRGYFAAADGGTLVLDEVGELAAGVQAKLLRALQEGEIQPVGASRIEKVNVRVIASTNRELAAEVKAGRFREDLYYRLAVVELVVPPLRDHREDVPALVEVFARRYRERFGVEDVRLSRELVDALARAEWPGNVRQLENAVARLVALAPAGELGVSAWEDAF